MGEEYPISDAVWERVRELQRVWQLAAPRPGKLLLIRPLVPGDDYTQLGSHIWAGQVKQKAIAEGWTVVDLDGNGATRAAIENAINNEDPDLIIHYDHGSTFTQYGQDSNALTAGLDNNNIHLATGKIASTVSCYTAVGLGPAAIAAGVRGYLGYTDTHTFVIGWAQDFGDAANAANFALLECKTVQQAFDEGWLAYDQLYNSLLAAGGNAATYAAPWALHDRDCFALLGTGGAIACPQGLEYCPVGLPNSEVFVCAAQPDLGTIHCSLGNPDMAYIQCRPGLPNMGEVICRSAPDLVLCGRGPDGCHAGPPLLFREIFVDYPQDLVLVDMDKVPEEMQKAFREMIDKMRLER